MWSLLSQAIPILKPLSEQSNITAPLFRGSDTTSDYESTVSFKVATPQQPRTLLCCPSHQIPSSHPTSHVLNLFLRALDLRRQQIYHPVNPVSTSTLFHPLLSCHQPKSEPPPPDVTNQTIIELETCTKDKSLGRTFRQKYYVPAVNLQRTEINIYPEGAFREVSFEIIEKLKRAAGGGKEDWGFVTRDEVVKNRASWCCERCGWIYWIRVIEVGE